MKALGIVGSPRRRGNTAKLVEKVLEGAEKGGIETEIVCLGDLQIKSLPRMRILQINRRMRPKGRHEIDLCFYRKYERPSPRNAHIL